MVDWMRESAVMKNQNLTEKKIKKVKNTTMLRLVLI